MFLERRYPELLGNIQGENYPPPQHALIAVQMAGMAQMATVAVMFFGDSVFTSMGIPAPSIVKYIQENKMASFMTTFLMNSMATSMTSTGAFEISVDGRTVYSKLKTGRMPSPGEIIDAFNALGLQSA